MNGYGLGHQAIPELSKNNQIIPKTSYESQTNQMTGEVDNSFVSSICLTLENIKNEYFLMSQ